MIINILKEVDDTKLWSAEKGKELRNGILDKISKDPVLDILVLDLNKIQVMDTSYAREGFVKLILEVSFNSLHPQIVLKNVDEYVKQNLHLSFKDHKVFALIVDSPNKLSLIGKFSEQNLDTINALAKRKEASAKQIAKDLGDIGVSSSINRLNQLYNFCVCRRKESIQATGGKEYSFKIEI